MGKGLFRYGFVLVIAIILQFITCYQKPDITFSEALPILALYLIFNLGVGLFEEVLCRGVLFNSFKEYFGDDKKGVYKAIFLSSGIFGIFHLINLISYPTLIIGTITQVLYAFFFGVIFCTVYYRSKNLLAGIILHALFDYGNVFWKCLSSNRIMLLESSTNSDMKISESLIVLGLTSIFFIASMIQLKKEFSKE
ncbi:MAG: CPBP family intramembrane metalloprotease [Eubacterium sp.]|nr:CPBP family intramembrane metalloprotease [Eubacterium sp.]